MTTVSALAEFHQPVLLHRPVSGTYHCYRRATMRRLCSGSSCWRVSEALARSRDIVRRLRVKKQLMRTMASSPGSVDSSMEPSRCFLVLCGKGWWGSSGERSAVML